MNTQKTNSAATTWICVVFGVVMSFFGMWLSKNWHPAFLETLAQQGIPLDFGKSIAAIGMFIALFKVLQMFYFNVLQEAIDTRNNTLAATFEEADSLKERMTDLKSSYETKLAQSENEARAQIQAAVSEAQQMREQIIAEARTQAEDVKLRAAEGLIRERAKLMADLRVQVVDLTLSATEKLIGEVTDKERQKKLIDDFITTAEVKN